MNSTRPARLAAAEGELSRLNGALATAQGELNTLGDPALFQARREELLEELQRRREEYEALNLALAGLEQQTPCPQPAQAAQGGFCYRVHLCSSL